MKLKPGKKMPLGIKQVETLVNMINLSCEEELDCKEVFNNLDVYAEFVLNSGEKTKIIRMIEDHLKLCRDCAEEFQLLLKALRA